MPLVINLARAFIWDEQTPSITLGTVEVKDTYVISLNIAPSL